jgi:quaternary ammonium compound-resistance protein SugE
VRGWNPTPWLPSQFCRLADERVSATADMVRAGRDVRRHAIRRSRRGRAAPAPHAKDEAVATAWLALLLAGLLEIGWALGLKYSDGLTRFWPSVVTVAAIAASFGLIGLSLKSLPFGTVYAVWTGIGAAGTMIVGMVAFGEPAGALRVTCLALIVVGIVGLKLASPS